MPTRGRPTLGRNAGLTGPSARICRSSPGTANGSFDGVHAEAATNWGITRTGTDVGAMQSQRRKLPSAIPQERNALLWATLATVRPAWGSVRFVIRKS